MEVKKTVIPATDLGANFLPATQTRCKETLAIAGRPTICHIVEETVAADPERIICAASEGKSAVENPRKYNFHFGSVQRESKAVVDEELSVISSPIVLANLIKSALCPTRLLHKALLYFEYHAYICGAIVLCVVIFNTTSNFSKHPIISVFQQRNLGYGGEAEQTDALSTLAGKSLMFACELTGRRYYCDSAHGNLKAIIVFGVRCAESGDSLRQALLQAAKVL